MEYEGEFRYNRKWNGKGYDEKGNIIYELINGNGKVREYDEYIWLDHLKFEGEYLNGERNGKGKEYDYSGKLEFEGEFKNGKRHGQGKGFNEYGNIIFEGEYLYGNKRKGKSYINEIFEFEGEYLYNRKYNGKGFDEKGNIIYELKNGNGKVKEYDDYGYLIYEGEYKNGKRYYI